MLATKLVGAIRGVVGALVRLCSAYSFSVRLPQHLPIESEHGEHLLSQRRLGTEHRPRARQRSVDRVGHGARMERPDRATGSAYLVGLTRQSLAHVRAPVRCMYRAYTDTEHRAGSPAEPLLGPFSRILGISGVAVPQRARGAYPFQI
jgi:hypothetical protein